MREALQGAQRLARDADGRATSAEARADAAEGAVGKAAAAAEDLERRLQQSEASAAEAVDQVSRVLTSWFSTLAKAEVARALQAQICVCSSHSVDCHSFSH